MIKWFIGFIILFVITTVVIHLDHHSEIMTEKVTPSSQKIELRKESKKTELKTPEPQKVFSVNSQGVPSEKYSVNGKLSSGPRTPQGALLPLSRAFAGETYTLEELKQAHPEFTDSDLKKFGTPKVTAITSIYSDDQNIPFYKLQTQCPQLLQLNFPVMLRINANGYPDDIYALGGRVDAVSMQVYNCQFTGGPNQPFVTTYLPLQDE